MAVKAGYKQTEVGVIPESWDVMTVAEAFEICNNLRLPLSNKVRAAMSGSYPYYGPTKVQDYINEYRVEGEYALIGEDGDHFLKFESMPQTQLATGKFNVNNHAHLIKSKIGSSQWFFYYFRNRDISVHLTRQGAGRFKLNKSSLGKIHCPIPEFQEQTAIATALSDADALIESLEQLIHKKRNIKQGAMQELLTGKKRLPGFSGEWEVKRLGDVADPNQKWSFTGGPFGSNLKSSDYIDDGIRIIQLQNIGDGEFHNESTVFTSQEKADELISCNIFPGDIILSKMGDPVARACIIPPYHHRYLMCSDGIRLAVDPKKYNTYFVFVSINAPDFRTRAENAGTGSTRKRIGLTELRNLELICPSLPEQTAIATILSDMDADIAALEEKLNKAKAVKQGMMQELLTGRVRLV